MKITKSKIMAATSNEFDITNYEEVVEELTDMLIQFDIDLNAYNTDVYLYHDKETGNATLDTFVNVSGHSWLDDDHYVLYRDKQHYDSILDSWTTIGGFANELNMSESDLIKETADYKEYDADELSLVDWSDVADYIRDTPSYYEIIEEAYKDIILDQRSEYTYKAYEIVDEFIKETNREIEWKNSYNDYN